MKTKKTMSDKKAVKSTKKSYKKKAAKTDALEPIHRNSKSIEDSYAKDKKEIDTAIKALKRDRLKAYIALGDKRKTILDLKKQKLDELEKNLTRHTKYLKTQIAGLRRKKIVEKGHFDRLYLMNEGLNKIEAQIKDIIVSRKILLEKEKELLKNTRKFFIENKMELSYHGLKRINKINEVLRKKTTILMDTAHLMSDDISLLFTDKKILEKMADNQLDKVYKINKQLKKLAEEHRALLKKMQALKAEDFEFEQMRNDFINKRESYLRELKGLGSE